MDDNQLLARIDERTERMEKALEKINDRLHDVETIEQSCPVRSIDLPARIRVLEDEYRLRQGMASMIKILAGGSVLAFFTAILSILKVLGIV